MHSFVLKSCRQGNRAIPERRDTNFYRAHQGRLASIRGAVKLASLILWVTSILQRFFRNLAEKRQRRY